MCPLHYRARYAASAYQFSLKHFLGGVSGKKTWLDACTDDDKPRGGNETAHASGRALRTSLASCAACASSGECLEKGTRRWRPILKPSPPAPTPAQNSRLTARDLRTSGPCWRGSGLRRH